MVQSYFSVSGHLTADTADWRRSLEVPVVDTWCATTISETFCSKYLTSFPIQPIHHLLEIEGAGGQSVPYLGYVAVPLTFPDSVTGAKRREENKNNQN